MRSGEVIGAGPSSSLDILIVISGSYVSSAPNARVHVESHVLLSNAHQSSVPPPHTAESSLPPQSSPEEG
jgi:hypothetical protein